MNTLQPETWIKNYGDYLFSIAMYKTNNKEVAEDLVQDSFLSAIKAKDTYTGEANEKTWLATILKNKVIDYYRKQSRVNNYNAYAADTANSFNSFYFETDGEKEGHVKKQAFTTQWENADALVDNKEFEMILQNCMGKLPTKLLPVFMRKFIDQEKATTICNELNITAANYWVLVHRAKLAIKSCLENNWFIKIN